MSLGKASPSINWLRARLGDFAFNESGSILIYSAFFLVFVVIGVIALSVDHGSNLMTHSSMEARLAACTKQATTAFTHYCIDKASGMTSGDEHYDGIISPPLPNAFVSNPLDCFDKAVTEGSEKAPGLKRWIENNCMKGEASGNSTTELLGVKISAIELNPGEDGLYVMDYYSKIPQQSMLSGKEKVANCDVDGKAPTEGCSITRSGVLTPFGVKAVLAKKAISNYEVSVVYSPENVNKTKASATISPLKDRFLDMMQLISKTYQKLNFASNAQMTTAIQDKESDIEIKTNICSLLKLGARKIADKEGQKVVIYVGRCPPANMAKPLYNSNVSWSGLLNRPKPVPAPASGAGGGGISGGETFNLDEIGAEMPECLNSLQKLGYMIYVVTDGSCTDLQAAVGGSNICFVTPMDLLSPNKCGTQFLKWVASPGLEVRK